MILYFRRWNPCRLFSRSLVYSNLPMSFQLIPIVDRMLELYAQPRSPQRFQEYLAMLRESPKGDMVLPIAAYNPMAKDQVVAKLRELRAIDAEALIEETLEEINSKIADELKGASIGVVLNMADDLLGGWTNHYTTDYDSKFKLHAIASRNFCTPFFWTSEQYSPELIRLRTCEYAYRTLYWYQQGLTRPRSLQDHLEQEIFVASCCQAVTENKSADDLAVLQQFYQTHQQSEDYSLIFNFFYGDVASHSLGFKTHGLSTRVNGYEFAVAVAKGEVMER